jgi:hypothetical protein
MIFNCIVLNEYISICLGINFLIRFLDGINKLTRIYLSLLLGTDHPLVYRLGYVFYGFILMYNFIHICPCLVSLVI